MPNSSPSMRCPWAIRGGRVLNTRCRLGTVPPHLAHEGPGLADFPYQSIHWQAGDRREYMTQRDDTTAWDQPSCPVPSSVSGGECLLPAGHAQDTARRFHRYAAQGGGLEP